MASAKGKPQKRATTNLIKMVGHVSHPTRRAAVTGCVGMQTKKPVTEASPVASPDHISQKRGRSCDNTDTQPHLLDKRTQENTGVPLPGSTGSNILSQLFKVGLPFFQERKNKKAFWKLCQLPTGRQKQLVIQTVLRESGVGTKVGPGFTTPVANTIWEYLLRKGIQSYEYKIVRVLLTSVTRINSIKRKKRARFTNEYSYRMRKEITTNYKF